MKVTRQEVNGGASVVNIVATIPAHFVRIEEDSDIPSKSFVVQIKQPDGSFSDEVTYGPGIPIIIQRVVGIIAMPPGFAAHNQPAVGQPYAKIRTSDASNATVRVVEHEHLPSGDR